MHTLRALLSQQTRGMALVWVAVMMPLFCAIVGLAMDGGLVFKAQRELQDTADAAARAGAMQLDQQAYRQSDGQSVALNPDQARQVAAQYAASEAPGVTGQVGADTQQVVVQLQEQVPTTFLRIVGINSVPIKAVAPARLRYGITQANGSGGP